MRVRTLVEIPSARGVIPQGQIMEIPQALLVKLTGKVELIPQAQQEAHHGVKDQPPIVSAEFTCRACGRTVFRQGYVSRICDSCQVPESGFQLGRKA